MTFWLEAKKREEYPPVPEIMIDDWFNKGNTNLNMCFCCWWTNQELKQKIVRVDLLKPTTAKKWHFYAVPGHKQPPDNQIIQFWHQVPKQFWKLWPTHFFGTEFKGGHNVFIYSGRLSQRERVLWGWLAGSSPINQSCSDIGPNIIPYTSFQKVKISS